LLQRLIDFVVSQGDGRTFKLSLQDIAVCHLWITTGHPEPTVADALSAVVHRWLRSPDMPELATAGRRHQLLLRTLIDAAQKKRLETLTGDETAFLCTVYELISKVHDRRLFQHVEVLLREHMRALADRRAVREPAPGLGSLNARVHYATEEDIRRAPQSQIRLLAGIEMPCRGPVFRDSGHLRILGDIPDNCTVVAEDSGSCCVDGYVMGRVLSKRQCEVRYNISGVAIVLDGHIRARGIINNAIAIAKMGTVHCVNAQGPRLVFGGKSISVAETAMMGRFITREMIVGRDVRGSHIEVAGAAEAPWFRHLGMSNMTIVLRRELSCADFGEVTGAELNQLLSRAYQLRRRARNLGHLATAARHEANHTAQSVLMMLFGGGEVQKRLESFLRAQRRHRFVCNVVENLRGMLDYAQESHHAPDDDDDDLTTLSLDGDAALEKDDADLIAARADAAKLHRSLRSRSLDRRQTKLVLDEIRTRLSAMHALRNQLAEQMAAEERGIQNIEKYEQILAGSGAESTKLDVLNKILPALQNQPPESTVGKRLRSPFVVRALRTMDRAVHHANSFEQKLKENLADFHAVSDRLGKDFQIRVLENPEDEQVTARVTGRFEAGTRIYMNAYAENLSELPEGSVLTAPDDNAVRTYIRSGDGTRFYSGE
jgi:hypothetical protein